MEEDKAVIAALIADWNINPEISITQEQIMEALALRIAKLLSGTGESFFQMMYRLDIGETKLAQALADPDPPAAIALLIWHRQLQKIQSRARYSPPKTDEDELKW